MINNWVVKAFLGLVIIINLFWIGLIIDKLVAQDWRYLHYKYNENAIVTISNVDCFLPELQGPYPWAAVATRIDGERLLGCYNHEGDNIVIQWWKGDKSVFNADLFKLDPNLDKLYKTKPTV
jgi:hypothetical protein